MMHLAHVEKIMNIWGHALLCPGRDIRCHFNYLHPIERYLEFILLS